MKTQDIDQQVRKMLEQPTSYARFFDKFDAEARKALVFADEEAALLNHNYIGTEHLLLGLLREEDGAGASVLKEMGGPGEQSHEHHHPEPIAASVLKEMGVTLQAVRAFVEQVVGRGEPQPDDIVRPMTPRAQVVLSLVVSESWKASRIGTEHLLLGLAREGEGLAAGALETLGVGLERLRTRVYQVIMYRGLGNESLKNMIRNKSNVVTCRIDDQDLDAIDELVEVGVRSTRSDAASWLIHAGIEANKAIFDSVAATVAEIRQLRTKAQALAQQVTQGKAVE